MKEYTADDCISDDYDDSTRVFKFDQDETSIFEVRIKSVTLQLAEEIERQDGGTVKEFAALMLNKHLTEQEVQQETLSFFEEISD